MPSKRRLLSVLLAIVLTGSIGFIFTPFLVSGGVRLWLWWKARTEKLSINIDSIEAPFFRPVTIRGLRIHSADNAAVGFNATAARVAFALNLRSILLRTRGRTLHHVAISDLHVEVHRKYGGKAMRESGLNTLQKLLPEQFDLQNCDLRIENGATIILLHNGSLTGSAIESGRFRAGAIVIGSPLFRQTFSDLRGATNWLDERLTIAGLTLGRGLDVQSVTFDLAHIGKRRMTIDLDLDTFGGKIRGSVSSEWRSARSNWNLAGSATDISLAQTAGALGFTNRVGGLLHVGKFTFHGDLNDPLRATGSLWTELTAPAWQDREADLIMLGLSLYNRQLDLQQLYVKQKKNQLTLSGQASFARTSAGLMGPDFRGDISAAISDLGDFATLFGGTRNDFKGRIAIEGTVNARDRKIGGNLTANGSALTVFKSSVDNFDARLNIRPNEVEIVEFQLARKTDLVRAEGRIALTSDHNYSGTLDINVKNISEYLAPFCRATQQKPMSAEIAARISSSIWQAEGVIKPSASTPIQFSAKFPLLIGQTRDELFNSAVALTIDFPQIALAQFPSCLSIGHVEAGTLSGKLQMSDTLNRPRILGDFQLAGGRSSDPTFTFSDVNGHITFVGDRATIDFLNLAQKDVRLSLFGDIDFADTRLVTARLFGTQPLFDATSAALSCVNNFELVAVPAPSGSTVAETDLRGGSSTHWQIVLREPALPSSLGALDWDLTRREFPLCSTGDGIVRPLLLQVQPAPPARPSSRRKKKER